MSLGPILKLSPCNRHHAPPLSRVDIALYFHVWKWVHVSGYTCYNKKSPEVPSFSGWTHVHPKNPFRGRDSLKTQGYIQITPISCYSFSLGNRYYGRLLRRWFQMYETGWSWSLWERPSHMSAICDALKAPMALQLEQEEIHFQVLLATFLVSSVVEIAPCQALEYLQSQLRVWLQLILLCLFGNTWASWTVLKWLHKSMVYVCLTVKSQISVTLPLLPVR